MENFKFDDTLNFDANLVSFLDYMTVYDPEMASILKAYISELKSATDDAQRRDARSNFNAYVRRALDALLDIEEKDNK